MLDVFGSDDDDGLDHAGASVAVVLQGAGRLERTRNPLYVEYVVPRYLDFEFRRLFRLSRQTAEIVVDHFEASSFYPATAHGRPRITAEKTCLIALTYLGTQMSIYQMADKFDVTESSAHMCIGRVLRFLNAISEDVIRWPTSEEQEESRKAFKAMHKNKENGRRGLPGAIGCIDGCHIEIKKPAVSEQSYFNRKKFHSILLQGICNEKKKFVDVFIGFPGSAHDARVLRESFIFEDGPSKCQDGYLLGDLAYPLLPWLMTPYKAPRSGQLESWQVDYNVAHSSQRVTIETTFGDLKQRFRRLYFVDTDTIEQAVLIVMGACVLTNICNGERDALPE
ncbi:unnamed protein product, partial [Ixodes hexagonus]